MERRILIIVLALTCLSFTTPKITSNSPPSSSDLPALLKPNAKAFESLTQPSIEAALNEDGTLRRGYEGSFDPEGYSMSYGPNGEPVFTQALFGTGDERWQSMPAFTELNDQVYAIAISGTNVYVGGLFTDAGGIANADRIAMWNGTSWSALGLGIDNNAVLEIAISGSNVYVGGSFLNAGSVANTQYIAMWNGTSWNALGTSVSGSVNAITISGSNVYVGGSFMQAGGTTTGCVAIWNGSSWASMSGGNIITSIGGGVNAIAVSGSNVYVGGDFTDVGSNTNNDRIVRWNGTSWNPLGTGLNSSVTAIKVSGSNVYAAGNFTDAGGNTSADRIAVWNGTSWGALGTGLNQYVSDIRVSGSNVYAVGFFTDAGGNASADAIAKWNGTSWTSMGYSLGTGTIRTVELDGTFVYVGGEFEGPWDNEGAGKVAVWNSTKWLALGHWPDPWVNIPAGFVKAVAVSGDKVYIGGMFQDAGGRSGLTNIAMWDGTKWNNMGSGILNYEWSDISGDYDYYDVRAIAVSGTTVYVGGYFRNAGGNADADFIAMWNGSSWESLGIGSLGHTVSAIAVIGSNVYVAGGFVNAGGNANADGIAVWNGSSWGALGTGVNGAQALAVSGNNLIVAGSFQDAGGNVNADRIAMWNGSSWSALGTGLNNTVNAVAVSGGSVYAAGYFTDAGGNTSADRVAVWNGTNWSALGTGPTSLPYAIAVRGDKVYTGREVWNGTSWTSLGTGLNDEAYSVAITDDRLYVGGAFSGTGDGSVKAYNIIQRNGLFPVATLQSPTAVSSTELKLNGVVKPGGLSGTYYFEYGTTNGVLNQVTNVQNISGSVDQQVNANVTFTTPNTTIYYRLRSENAEGVSYSATNSYTFPAEIEVRQATTLASGDEYNFGNVNFQSSSAVIGFTLHNLGLGSLNLTGSAGNYIVKGGTNPGDFTVVQSSITSSVSYNDNKPFSVQFTPQDGGVRTATLTITSNDPDEGSYVVKLKGTGVKLAQTITFGALPAKIIGDAAFTLSATASSTLPVSYSSSTPAVATVSGNTVTIVAPGTTVITASQPGNASYDPAPDVQQTLVVRALQPAAQPTSLTFSNVTASSLTGSFTAAAGPPDGYLVLWKTGAYPEEVPEDGVVYSGTFGSSNVTTTATASFSTTGMISGTTYYYSVFAFNGSGQAINYVSSAPLKNEKITIPAAPQAQSADGITSNFFQARWAASTGAQSYAVDVSESENFSTRLAAYDNKNVGNVVFLGIDGLASDKIYYYRVMAVNSSGNSAYSGTISAKTSSGSEGLSISVSTISGDKASVTLQKGSGPRVVKFYSKGILKTNFSAVKTIESTSDKYEVVIPAEDIDAMGAEFYFTASDNVAVIPIENPRAYLYRSVAASAMQAIPFAGNFNGKAATYEMFSIPYNLTEKNIASIFDEAGTPDKDKWRVLHFQGGTPDGKYIEYPSLVNIEPGKGYWFNAVTPVTIKPGAGTIVEANQTDPFKIALEKGWNQVGNPYPFNIEWAKIKTANQSAGLNSLWLFENGAYVKKDVLATWKGAFVFSDNGGTISFPVTAATTSTGRSASTDLEITPDEANWILPITIRQNDIERVAGIGMHTDASLSKDRFDEITIPRFTTYVEMFTHHNEFFANQFATDVVPTQNNFNWTFTIASNNKDERGQLTWDQRALSHAQANLMLIDMYDLTMVDMKSTGSYNFSWREDRQFKVVYSREGELKPGFTMLGNAYPNPFQREVVIPVLLEEAQESIQLEFFDVLGRSVKTISKGHAQPGVHNITWDGTDTSGASTGSGLYFYQLRGDKGMLSQTKRLIKQ